MPKSLEAYYQEAGRAGRDGCDADCILLYAPQDVITARWLIEHSEPNPDLTEEEQAQVREKDEERLKWMVFYAKSRKCLRQNLLRYFGEKAPDTCGNCSNCVPDCEHVDITTEAQMILSCVARTGQQHTEEVVIQLMLGVLPYPPPEGINPAELTTFGLMNDVEESVVRDITEALLDQGYLERDDQDCLKLNDQSREVLYSKRRVTMKRGLKDRKEIGGEDLFQALQRLRYEISAREYVAASTLFSDGTLRDICKTLPRTKKQLAAVDGMGVFKANRYGDQILLVIRRYAPEPEPNKTKSSGKAQKKSARTAHPGSFQAYKDKVIEKGSTEAYQSWSKEEDQQLIREHKEGKTTKEMAEIHKRNLWGNPKPAEEAGTELKACP
jgi:ATP-dependent DNA helicase RecQ